MKETTFIPKTDPVDNKHIWVGTWLSSPTGVPKSSAANPYTENLPISVQGTIRYRLRISHGGTQARIRISNECGENQLEIGAVSIGLVKENLDAYPGTLKSVTFAGKSGITIPAGAPALSDPVELRLNSLCDLVVSLYLPSGVTMLAQSTQVDTAVMDGADLTLVETFPPGEPVAVRPLISAIDVLTENTRKVVVAFGDSLTDGVINPDTWERGWPGALSRNCKDKGISVLNAGIGGNRLLGSVDILGRAALARMDQDVLSVSGLTHIVVMLGTNDIGHGDLYEGVPMVVPVELFAAYSQIVARAHACGVKVLGCTLPPFGGSDFYSERKETIRQTVNYWIKTSNTFDGVIDIDKHLHDISDPSRLLTDYDMGDRLHINFLGYQVMADAIGNKLLAIVELTNQ